MDTISPFEAFCQAVCRHIRYLPAHRAVSDELTGHMEDHARRLTEQGTAPEEAAAQAVAAMGDPEEIGAALDRQYRPWLFRLEQLVRYTAVVFLAVLAVTVTMRLMDPPFRGSYGIQIVNPDLQTFSTWEPNVGTRMDHSYIKVTHCWLTRAEDGSYTLLYDYDSTSLFPLLDSEPLLPTWARSAFDDQGRPCTIDDNDACRGIQPDAKAIQMYHQLGNHSFRVTIPLEWGNLREQ